VTATNAAGSASSTSAATTKVAAAAPQSLSAPTVSGSPVDGQTLTATAGSWSGNGLAYAYQWRRCAAGGSCVDIAGATGSSYTLTGADVGSFVAVVVTATNAGGSASAVSAAVGAVTAAAPDSTAAPSVSGSSVEGQTLTATSGTWSGNG